MIKRVCLLESNTNIDDIIGISIDGLPTHEFTANGLGVGCFLTGSGRVTHPRELFSLSGNTELGMAWMQQYPKYTSDNLVLDSFSKSYTPQSHSCPLLSATFAYGAPRLGFPQCHLSSPQ